MKSISWRGLKNMRRGGNGTGYLWYLDWAYLRYILIENSYSEYRPWVGEGRRKVSKVHSYLSRLLETKKISLDALPRWNSMMRSRRRIWRETATGMFCHTTTIVCFSIMLKGRRKTTISMPLISTFRFQDAITSWPRARYRVRVLIFGKWSWRTGPGS